MRVSPSSISNFLRCRQLYHYANQLRVEPLESKPAFFLGSAIHHALQHWYADDPTPDPVKLLQDWGKREMLRIRSNGAPLDVAKYAELLELGTAMLDQYRTEYGATPAEDKDGIHVLVAEKEFIVAIPGTDGQLIGRIDALCRDPYGGVWVFETKTYTQAPTQHEMNLQTLAYVWAFNQPDAWPVLESLGIPPGTPVLGSWYNGLRKQAWKPSVKLPLLLRQQWPRSAGELANFGALLADIYRDMSDPAMRVYPTFTSECHWCSYVQPCGARLTGDDEDWVLDTFFQRREYVK